MASVVGKSLGLIHLSNNAGLNRIHNNGTAVIVSSNPSLSPQLPSLTHQTIKSEHFANRDDRGTVLVTNNNNINTANNNNNTDSDLLRCKRRINFAYTNMPNHQPASVARRNARERNRVKQVNNGFATLRAHIPISGSYPQNTSSRGANKKMSKVETLRMAVEYIKSLKDLLDEHSPGDQNYSQYEDSFKLEFLSPTCSENSTSPPPSSYTSEGSYTTPIYEPMTSEEDITDEILRWQSQ